MKEDKRVTEKDVDEAEVHLKPVFGIAPGRYLTIIYSLGVLTALFLVLLYPGIRNPGTVFRIESDPPGSAVILDGAYKASTPATIFLPAGSRQLRMEHPGFIAQEQTLKVGAQLFGTLFFNRESGIRVSLEAGKTAGTILSQGIKEYSWWALAGQPSASYQIPMVLSEAALAWTAIPSSQRSAVAADFASAAFSYTAQPQSARDALRASILVAGESAVLTPVTLGLIVDKAWNLLANDPAFLPALASVMPADVRQSIESTALYKSLMDAAGKSASSVVATAPSGRRMAAGEGFIEFQTGSTVIRANSGIPAVIVQNGFALAETETTVARYREFIRENPQWSASATDSLQAAGLVDASYLKDFESAGEDQPVRYVSRAAAEAYTEWLSTKAPSGYRFDLPTEAQWNRAAEASAMAVSRPDAAALFAQGRTGPSPIAAMRTDSAGFKGLLGGVWEWCADPYSVHPGTGISGRLAYPGHDGLVRGGSWANRADLVELNSRGPLAPESCNAYTGFRIALVPVKD
jgi:formylglycine-generating enzyme required for sulfatase activity